MDKSFSRWDNEKRMFWGDVKEDVIGLCKRLYMEVRGDETNIGIKNVNLGYMKEKRVTMKTE